MNYEYLNQMIKYIEDNLAEDIEYKELAKIVGVSEYNLQRIFTFLTNMSLSEYIRKRKLSKSFEELKTTNIKVIDLAIKYGYDSQISFGRAFKAMFGITPSECRNSNAEFKQFPIIRFNDRNQVCEELNYEIKNVDKIKLYCIKIEAKTYDDLLYRIRELYSKIRKNGIREKFDKNGMYGITIYEKDNITYLVGSREKFEDTEEFVIEKGRYVVFSAGSQKQKDIVKAEKILYTQWSKSTNYIIDGKINIELYKDNNCYLYVKIKGKQN